MCKEIDFKLWLETHQPDHGFSDELISKVMESNPKIGFKKLSRILSKESKTTNNETEEVDMTDKEQNQGQQQQEQVDQTKNQTQEQATPETETGVTYTITPRGRADDLVDSINDWAQENPKTAVAIGVGTVALAGYGAYKFVKSLV